MSDSRKCLIYICSILCFTGAASQEFQLEPQNLFVLKDSDAQFRVTIQGPWEVMTWDVGDVQVLTLPINSPSIPATGRFEASFCVTDDTSCVQFTIINTTRNDTGRVACTVQNRPGQKVAQLHVQESGTVSILGGDTTVPQDEQVEFQCVTSAWFPTPTITWNQNGEAVNSSLYNTTSVADGDFFNATSVLKFQAVRNTTVQCLATIPALTNPVSSSVFMVVDATVPVPPDWTVLIAVVVSFGGCALLVLLIIAIVYCCKRRKQKQTNYQDEMRRVRTQSVVSVSGQRQGRVNNAYTPDSQTSVAPSEVSDFDQEKVYSVITLPDILHSHYVENSDGGPYNTVDETGFRKHRHVTIV
ncbi:immunoglobulin superfamily member 5 isoform X2 [Mugil cephalus]|uniref:immunoglobulin superfamily member 5 isoform X2 n=1 Tax=Mugil cephalus TaxID=48193 RepID=UPI001FB83353|nr:immunoglobulin superfamily member 5 isoform X2 [Mugil cephalus]